eukprot:Nk52_evm88s2367 gene=Nk52_evmTU88s2367
MPNIQWMESEHSLGIDQLDLSNQEMFRRLNAFEKCLQHSFLNDPTQPFAFIALDAQTERQKLIQVYNGLVQFIEHKLKKEEILLELYEYPTRSSHQMQHRRFLEQILDMKEQAEDGHAECLDQDHAQYMWNWVLSHLEKEDKKMARYLRGKVQDDSGNLESERKAARNGEDSSSALLNSV